MNQSFISLLRVMQYFTEPLKHTGNHEAMATNSAGWLVALGLLTTKPASMAGTRVSLLPSVTPRSNSCPAVSCLPNAHRVRLTGDVTMEQQVPREAQLTCLCTGGRSCLSAAGACGRFVPSVPPRSLPGGR